MLKRGTLGVHPIGALGVALYVHARAECFIGRGGGGSTEIFRRAGWLRLDEGGVERTIPLAGRVFSNLLEADAHGTLPELLLVCCNPSQIASFTAELTTFLASQAERGHLQSGDEIRRRVPILLLLPNGILADEAVETYRRQLTEARLLDRLPGVTPEMIEQLLGRIVRGVSFQAGGRRGEGEQTVYLVERCGSVVFAGGALEARQRIDQIFAEHGYPAEHIPNVPASRIEFDKAMISIVINVGGLIHMVGPDGELIDMRMGDLCRDETQRPFIERIARAVFEVGQRSGAYGSLDAFDKVWAGHRATILAHADHVTSSVKSFRDAVESGHDSIALMTNEQWILTPLERDAARAGMNAEVELFRSLAEQVQEAMARAIKRRQRDGASSRSVRSGERAMKLTAQRNISIELFEDASGDNLLLVGTMLDNEHLIKLEMTIHLADEQITRSHLEMIRVPFTVCRHVENAAEQLVGLRIQRGVLNQIAERVGGRVGCSHLKEMATNIVYFAASYLARRRAGLDVVGIDSSHIPAEEKFRLTRTFLNGSCLAYCQSSPLALDEQMGIRRLGQVHASPIPLGDCEPSLGVVVRQRAARFGDKPYLRWRKDFRRPGRPAPADAAEPPVEAETLSFNAFAHRVFQIARHLIAHDLRKGDRVAMISENRAEMFLFELAAQSIGVVSVPVFAGYPAPQISYVLRHARPQMAVVSGRHQLDKIERERHPWIETWYCMDSDDQTRAWGALDFEHLLQPGGALTEELEARIDAVQPDDLCLVMYTSGTTGPPKGVMLAHRNLISQQKAISLLWDVTSRDVFLSYLPWHHSFGGLFERFMTLYHGCEFCLDDSFGRDIDRLLEAWRLFNPTLFFSVPRVHDLLLARCREEAAAEDTVFGNRLRFVFTAGASLPAKVAATYAQRQIPVVEGWGLTETSPCCTVTWGAGMPQDKANWRSGYVGWPIPGVSIRIGSDQEVLVRGPNVMRGYLDDEEVTSRVLDEEGWFHTGDLGEFSPENGLRILGRRDGAFKLTTGEKVHPHRIENLLSGESLLINTALILGSGQNFVAALIFPDRGRLRHWAAEQGLDFSDFPALLEHPAVRELYEKEIARINALIEVKYHRVQRFLLSPRELALERGEVTPSGKVCRPRVCSSCQREIDLLFEPEPREPVTSVSDTQLARATP